jgi:hypothetical protein
MNANKGLSNAKEPGSVLLSQNTGLAGEQIKPIGARTIRVHSRPFAVATILLLTAGMPTKPASAGPFETLKNFFVRPQPPAHVTHHRPAHPKEAKDAPKDAPNDSPSPVAPPVDQQPNQQPNQQTNGGPGQQNTLNTNNRAGRPAIAAAPLF